jgi:serine/threonine protein phosphatase PrpC
VDRESEVLLEGEEGGEDCEYHHHEDTHDKINQDRGCVCHPLLDDNTETLLLVLDGHGEQGDRVSEFAMREIVKVLKENDNRQSDPPAALMNAFLKAHGALMVQANAPQPIQVLTLNLTL